MNDIVTKPFGPHEGGHFLFLFGKLGIDGDYTDQVGRLESPTYRDTNSECHMSFAHYINGDMVRHYIRAKENLFDPNGFDAS